MTTVAYHSLIVLDKILRLFLFHFGDLFLSFVNVECHEFVLGESLSFFEVHELNVKPHGTLGVYMAGFVTMKADQACSLLQVNWC